MHLAIWFEMKTLFGSFREIIVSIKVFTQHSAKEVKS